jgi:serine/threonine protein kinase
MSDLFDRLQSALGDTYRLDTELSGGGMSRVFLAEEKALNRKVVIKLLPPEMAAGVNIDRFEREIQLAASLQHPHVVPLLTAGSHDDLLYYVMPFIEGESLRAKLAREGELPIGETLRILRDVADALAYAHRHKVVHRDIKPDNVMLSDDHALVTDFGVAKAVTDSTGGQSLTSMGVGHARLHVTGAGGGQSAGGSPGRHLRVGRARLRNALRAPAVLRGESATGSGGPRDPGARPLHDASDERTGGPERIGDAVPGEAAGRPVAAR